MHNWDSKKYLVKDFFLTTRTGATRVFGKFVLNLIPKMLQNLDFFWVDFMKIVASSAYVTTDQYVDMHHYSST